MIQTSSAQEKKPHHHRGRRGSRRRSSTGGGNSIIENDSPALQSIQDLIAEMRRLPHLDEGENIEGEDAHLVVDDWPHQHSRRYSEPPASLSRDRHQVLSSSSRPSNGTSSTPAPPPPTATIPETTLPAFAADGQVDMVFIPKRGRSQSLPHISTQPPPNAVGVEAASSARRPLYPAHLAVADAMQLVQQHQLFTGLLEVDWQDSSDAHVICEDFPNAAESTAGNTISKIYIYGSRNRNRALHGDLVAVELVDVETMMAEKAAKKQARRRSSIRLSTSLHSIPEHSSIHSNQHSPTYCGRVVSILERPKRMLFSGTLSLDRPSSQQPPPLSSEAMGFGESNYTNHHRKKAPPPKIIWFVPADKRLPLVAVPVKHAPQGFIKHHDEFKYRIFIGSIQRWPVTSLHPFGAIEREIGWMGELTVHSKALLADHHLKDTDFAPTLLQSANNIPSPSPEDHKRLDLQDIHVFTLSDGPAPDHGFSIKRLENGMFEVGVHAADVACILKPNSLVSREARERGVAVPLVERRVPMFPESFADENVVFRPGKTRMALSVLCRLTKSGVLMHTWIGKTMVTIADPSSEEVQDKKEMLRDICTTLQTRRVQQDNGLNLGLTTAHVPIFETDPNSGYPFHVMRPHLEESVLEQELLILSGQQVAQKISTKLPENAFLCRQTGPLRSDPHQRDLLLDFLDLGRETSYGQMIKMAEQQADENRRYAALYLLQPSPEKYVCSGSVDIAKYRHEAYAVPVYTVFAEPLQKYACLVVQHQLHAVLKDEAKSTTPMTDRGTIEKAARHCTSKQRALHDAVRASRALFTSAYVYRECLDQRPVVVSAVVIGLSQNALTVYLPDYDLEKEVHLHTHHHRGLLQATYRSSDQTVELMWEYEVLGGAVLDEDEEETISTAPSLPMAAAATSMIPVGRDNTSNEDHSPLIVTLEDEESGVRQTSTVVVDFMTVLQVRLTSDMKVVRPTLDIELVNPLAQ